MHGTGSTVRQVIEVAREVTGRPIAVRNAPRRPGDPPHLVAAPGRAAALLGWRATRSDLPTIVESAWRWHRAARS